MVNLLKLTKRNYTKDVDEWLNIDPVDLADLVTHA